MDPHIEELFEAAQPFEEGDIMIRPDYIKCSTVANQLEDLLMESYGEETAQLICEYLMAHLEVERFQCLHYFLQGYLAGRKRRER